MDVKMAELLSQDVRAGGGGSQKGLEHMPALKLKLRLNNRGLSNPGDGEGGAESGARDDVCGHAW